MAAEDEIEKDMREAVLFFLDNTLNLVKLNSDLLPEEGGSGMLLERGGRYFVLSARHAIGSGRWTVETKVVVEDRLSLQLELKRVEPAKPHALSGHDYVDFAWCELDWKALETQFKADSRTKGKTLSLPIYRGPLNTRPTRRKRDYGFAAFNRVAPDESQFPKRVMKREASYELGMKYSGQPESNGWYRFELAREHQGDAYYEGASGAPIFDLSGRIVALVLDGHDGYIWGLPLAEYEQQIV